MRFAIDAHTIGRHLTGNEVYVRNLLENYARLDRDSQFVAYVCSEYAASEVPNRFHKRYVSVNPFQRLGLDLSWRTVADEPDLLHVQYTAPLYSAAPLVVSVHDVSFLDCPHYFKTARRLQLRTTVSHTVRRASKIITVSEFSRQRILATYDVAPESIHVIYNGVSQGFRPIPASTSYTRVNQRFGVNWPYVLSVGDLQPRKNHLGLIEAFAQLLRENPTLPHHLLLVGKPTWFAPRVYECARASGFVERIHFTGFVNDEDLVHLYNAAELLVYPSFYEGFGLPIVEAQACGCPVACSNTSAMPEVAGTAALLFDPDSREQMFEAMQAALLDSELRQRLEKQGQKNALRFSWERAADETLDVYYEVAGRPRRRAAERLRKKKSSAARTA